MFTLEVDLEWFLIRYVLSIWAICRYIMKMVMLTSCLVVVLFIEELLCYSWC